MNLNRFFSKRIINIFLLTVFTFNCVFIPYDTFELKMISFFLMLILNVKDIFCISENDEVIIFLFGFLLTSFNIIVSIILAKGSIYSNIQQGYAPYIMLLYPIIKKSKIPFEKIIIPFLKGLVYLVVLTVVLDLLNILPLYSNKLMTWYHYSENGMIGKGTVFAVGYMIFIKTTPMLIVLIPFLINKKDYISCVFTLITLIVSGTRANMIVGVFVLCLCVMYEIYKNCDKRLFIKIISILFIILLFIIIKTGVIDFVIQMFVNKASNDSIRYSILETILNSWKNKPLDFFIGSGYTAKLYDVARNQYTYTVELSYWNLLRQVGFLPFLLIMLMYLLPVIFFIKSKANLNYVIAYVGYLIIAYTNPLLYTSTGLVTLLFIYYMCFIYYKNNEKIKNYRFIEIIKKESVVIQNKFKLLWK